MKNQSFIEDAVKCSLLFLENKFFADASCSPYQKLRSILHGNITNRYKVFHTLAELTNNQINAGRPIEEYRYNSFEIALQFNKDWKTGWDIEHDNEKLMKTINRYFKELNSCISNHKEEFREIAIQNNFSAIPIIEKIESNGGNPNSYYISYEKIDISKQLEIEEKNNKCPKDFIRYNVENIETQFFNWRYNYELSGFRLYLDLFSLLFSWLIVILVIMYWFPFYLKNIFSFEGFKNIYLLSISTFFIFILPIKAKWDCITKRITSILPPLAAPSRFTETQLECVATNEIRESTGKPIRKIQLVSYWASCPICKEKLQQNVRIDVSKGGKEFHNRLIGRCSESPTEHVYSFDRITRVGKPLRGTM